jgi:hypothetical protein
MSNRLTDLQRRKLENIFNNDGYTPKIASSDDKLTSFFAKQNIDIMLYRKTNGMWLSKGKTMSVFWEKASDRDVLCILQAIYEKLMIDQEIGSFVYENSDYSEELDFLEELINIISGSGIKLDITSETITKETLMPHINELISKERYLLALDKVHTLFIHLVKDKLKGLIDFKNRHSLEYLLQEIIKNRSMSEVVKQKLKGDVNFSKIFNDARNNSSFAHDNEATLLSLEDAKILCETFIISINILDKL